MLHNPIARKIQKHKLKCWPEYFQSVKAGVKTFELRKDDRGFAVGDILILEEYCPETGYTGDMLCAIVTYKLAGFAGVEPGFCILSISLFELSFQEVT